MSRYIDLEKLIKSVSEAQDLRMVKDLPTVDRIALAAAFQSFYVILRNSQPEDVVSKEQYDGIMRRFQHLIESPYIKSFDEWDKRKNDYKRDIKEADVEPVRHGHWEEIPWCYEAGWFVTKFRCSLCLEMSNKKYNYCPNCGAKMDEE